MKSSAYLVTLGFAALVSGKTAKPEPVPIPEFKMQTAFDFSLHTPKSKMCDLRVGSGVSLIDCGNSLSTFDTMAALKGKGKLHVQKYEGKVSFLQRYGDYGYGSGWQYLDEKDGFTTITMEGSAVEKYSYSLDSIKDILITRNKPLNMGLVDDTLVVLYDPHLIETFELNHDAMKVERGIAQQTWTMNNSEMDKRYAPVQVQFAYEDEYQKLYA